MLIRVTKSSTLANFKLYLKFNRVNTFRSLFFASVKYSLSFKYRSTCLQNSLLYQELIFLPNITNHQQLISNEILRSKRNERKTMELICFTPYNLASNGSPSRVYTVPLESLYHYSFAFIFIQAHLTTEMTRARECILRNRFGGIDGIGAQLHSCLYVSS